MRGTLAERFWAKVERRGAEECWPWTAYRYGDGYGQIREAGAGSRLLAAHRVAYELAHGPIQEGMFVLHSCDNPPCVNPAHLRVGTAADNAQDAVKRDRVAYGRRQSRVRWTWHDVVAMRLICGLGCCTLQEIADAFGCSQPVISMITRGVIWRREPGASPTGRMLAYYGRETHRRLAAPEAKR
jgi:hypothetical protein